MSFYFEYLTIHKSLMAHSLYTVSFHVSNKISFFSHETEEYKEAMEKIMEVKEEHEKNMKPGKPIHDWCDLAIQVGS